MTLAVEATPGPRFRESPSGSDEFDAMLEMGPELLP